MRISDWSSDVCSSDLKHNIEQHYVIDGLSDDLEVPGTVDNIWLTKQIRVDRDYAAFGEVSFDITEQLTLTGGGRVYKFDNSLVGFFGYSNPGFSSNPVYACQGPAVVDGSPDRKSVVQGKSGTVRGDPVGRRRHQNRKTEIHNQSDYPHQP